MRYNAVAVKSKAFAIRAIRLYQYLSEEKHEYTLSRQTLRSGTNIGANVKEAIHGQTNPDFYSKMNIALKEAAETEYWLELLYKTGYIDTKQFESIYCDCQELIRLLVAITKRQKN